MLVYDLMKKKCTPAAAYINGISHIFALNTGRTARGRPPPGTGMLHLFYCLRGRNARVSFRCRALRKSPERLSPVSFSFFRRVVLDSLMVRTDRTKLVSRVEDTGDSDSVVLRCPAVRAGHLVRSSP